MQHIPTVLDHGFEYVGGDLATDFANTTSNRYEPVNLHEHIQTYADLVEFARLGGAIRPTLARKLIVEAERHPDKASQIYRRAAALREAIWGALSKIAAGKEPPPSDVALISGEAADALAHAQLTRAEDGYEWRWPETDELAQPLWPIARAASDVLTSQETRPLVRECADDNCAWLFVDRTKNHSRRWCDMNGCGTRNKVREFRQRQKRVTRKAR